MNKISKLHKQGNTQLLTVDEAAEFLRIHPYTVRRLARNGNLQALKIGGQWRFEAEQLTKNRKE